MDDTSSGFYLLTYLACVGLPEAYTPANTALRVSGVRKPPLHEMAVALEEGRKNGLRKSYRLFEGLFSYKT
jgi:hypothetical protein